MADLTLAAAISGPAGWLELEDEYNGYTLHSESFSERAVSKRAQSVDGVWIDGTFARRATAGNVTEKVSIWVDGDGSHYAMGTKLAALYACLDQVSFSFQLRIGDSRETWSCPMPADYTEIFDQPYIFATKALVQAQIQRLPAITLEMV